MYSGNHFRPNFGLELKLKPLSIVRFGLKWNEEEPPSFPILSVFCFYILMEIVRVWIISLAPDFLAIYVKHENISIVTLNNIQYQTDHF